jgi:germination protein M
MGLKKILALTLVLAMLSLMSGCALLDWIFPDKTPLDDNPNNPNLPPGDDDLTPNPPVSGDAGQFQIWVIDHAGKSTFPVTLNIPKAEGIAREVLKHMVEGGPSQETLTQKGVRAALPAGTLVLGISIRDGVCTIDFNEKFLDTADDGHETLMLTALVYTLTEFPTIESVIIWVKGHPVSKMKHGTPVAPVLSRQTSMINPVPLMVGTGAAQMKIWLRLDNLASGAFLVPVTTFSSRPMNTTAERVSEVIRLLMQTPPPGSRYSSPLPDSLHFRSVEIQGKTANVYFDGSLGVTKQVDLLVGAVVLTLTELPNIDKVRITISGEHVRLPDGKVLSEPISRPVSVNPLAL